MSFISRLTSSPRIFDTQAGDSARALVPELAPDLLDLVSGAASCSPYIATLVGHEHNWLMGALETPENSYSLIIRDLKRTDYDTLPRELRRAKRRVALLTALADLGGVWSLEETTHYLTDFADHACALALRAGIYKEIRRKKLPGKTEDDLENAAGVVVLAMGKMGAHELNYSSDIDLICLFDESQYASDDYYDARSSLVRATRTMSAMLNDKTADGYVFRTDLRLRPDPAVTPVCMAIEAAEQYYESLGRTWERAAYIKARPCAGDLAAGERFLKTLTPFVWRKHLDFAAIEDAHNMRLRIREHKGLGGTLALPGHNMKLGRGGIREIEFFTQTRQLISGGRDPDLRVRGTVEGLARLTEKGWVPEHARDLLTQNYRFHREVEHRLQMLRDAQTHSLPKSQEEFERLACFMNRDRADLMAELHERLNSVHLLIEGFFAPQDEGEAVNNVDAEFDSEVLARWPSYPALRSDRAVAIFRRLRPDILSRLSRTANPKESLQAFDAFLAGLPAGVQVFALFEANPQLIDLLIDIAGTSPMLAAYLARNSSVFDGVIAGAFFDDWPGRDALALDLTAELARFDDYERRLDRVRRWNKEWHFRIGVHHLRGLIDADQAAKQYADLAEAVLETLLPVVMEEFARKHGPAPGRGAVVLGMGSLGAARLTSQSDLDLIVIYDADGVETSEGLRPLMSRQYYIRLTQALITALTAPMAEGRLYEVDMRLRPSGSQGPVATSWQSFQDYQAENAWTWEHLALTRARAIAGSASLAEDIENFRLSILERERSPAKVAHDVIEMRERIAAAKAPSGEWDAKIGPGRLQDVELFSQAICLISGDPTRDTIAALEQGGASGWVNDTDEADLITAYRLCWRLQMVARLIDGARFDPAHSGEGGQLFLLRETGFESLDELSGHLQHVTVKAGEMTGRLLSSVSEGG